MARDPQTAAHLEWIGFVQPVGLVVSIPALLNAQAYINKNISSVHQRFLANLQQNGDGEPVAKIADFRQFVFDVLEWQLTDLVEVNDANCDSLEVLLPEYQERLRPTFVVPELRPKEGQSPWQMIIQVVNDIASFDEGVGESKQGWHASPQAKFERLLRETEIPIGLLVNSGQIRLVYAPRGESSGYITFSVADMIAVAGRPILAALYLLLSVDRLFLLQQESQRLPAILLDSRKYQNTVSTALAQQVVAALFEFLRGFQAANDQSNGKLLEGVLKDNPTKVNDGLLTVLMRLVFILYAEDRNLLSNSSVYSEYYSVSRLYERLREDAGRYPDTMDNRYGAWAQLLTLFRLLYEGGSHGDLRIPARKGHLFDPNAYPFLEGHAVQFDFAMIPRVSDGVVFRVLNNLLMLEGERLSYRTLDVEQIGSVYEAIMGFTLEVATGTSIAIKPKKQHGAPTTVNLEILLALKPAERGKQLGAWTDQTFTGAAARAIKEASSVQDLLVALEAKVAKTVTPHAVPRGSMILQPSNERRKSGSHYTPRSLTEPIVRTTLKPIIQRLGANPTPEQILDIKICDPAMGSGAFLVESCRQLGDELVKAWGFHKTLPDIPADEDELLHARRLIVQRCVYGVDRNHMAVNLAKLSLWLATLAKDHAFTFLDHSLRCGDSLIGLSREQIVSYHWQPRDQKAIDEGRIKKVLHAATGLRKKILDNAENMLYPLLQASLRDSDRVLGPIRLLGDSVLAAFFSSNKDRERNDLRDGQLPVVSVMLEDTGRAASARTSLTKRVSDLCSGSFPIEPFHWEIEFPEVFDRGNPGFDGIVGNPPFLGGSRISTTLGSNYLDWLLQLHPRAHGNGDLVAHFYRRSYNLLRNRGSFGLIATNTIAQGDTRTTGLQFISINGGTIYAATRRIRWPGEASVMVSVVHVFKGQNDALQPILDGRQVPKITAFLYHGGENLSPAKLVANGDLSFAGIKIYGQGFVFDDDDPEANIIENMRNIVACDKRNSERIFPYIGGEELNESPTLEHKRYVIDLSDLTLEQAAQWPDLLAIVREKVKPFRDTKSGKLKEMWWQFERPRPALRKALSSINRTLACVQVSKYFSFVFQPTNIVISQRIIAITLDSYSAFACLQSVVHLQWSYFQGSTMEDRPVYTPSDCFETFPFPLGFVHDESLERVGKTYYDYRSKIMIESAIGLTDLYNQFHDPNERGSDIIELRRLQLEMDRAVLNAYGWNDIDPTCEFVPCHDAEKETEQELANQQTITSYRWTWPEVTKDEVLARLLELNRQRAVEEALAGAANAKPKAKPKKKLAKASKTVSARAANKPEDNRQLTIAQIE